jgi:hypothetical protein
MVERMATLEQNLAAVAFDDAANEVVITGANLCIVNGLGATPSANGLGNLIVGDNELRNDPNFPDMRNGSPNMVVGTPNNISLWEGLVVGILNEISGAWAPVCGGSANTASGTGSSVSGGLQNTTSGLFSSVSGGHNRTAPAQFNWPAGVLFSDL